MSFNDGQLEEIGLTALLAASAVHDRLGADGLEEVGENEWHTALKCDVDCERAVIDIFRRNNVPIVIISEEHGRTEIGENPKYVAVLDGLDGTGVYKVERGIGRYATMLAIFDGTNPKHDDYIFSGMMVHAEHTLMHVTRGDKTVMRQVDDEPSYVQCLSDERIDSNSLIYLDLFWEKVRTVFEEKLAGHNIQDMLCLGMHLFDVAQGKAVAAGGITAKDNLEMAIAYGLIKGAGGDIITLDGQSIGPKKYLEFKEQKDIPYLGVCTKALGQDLIRTITSASSTNR